MPETRIEFPFDGMSENLAYTDQPPRTSWDEQNVRGIDPATGRIRGAQRSGLTEYVDANAGTAVERVHRIESLVLQDPLTTFTENAQTTLDVAESVKTQSGGTCRNFAVDRQENVYALDGRATVTKYTSELERVYTITVPVDDDRHALGEIVVDDFNSFYVGVREGGQEEGARIWKYTEVLDEEEEGVAACRKATNSQAEVTWEIVTDGYVKGLRLHRGRLYCILDFPEENRAELRVYGGIDTSEPVLEQSREVPYPATSISVGEDGSIFATADVNDTRGAVPRAQLYTAKSVDWTPLDLDSRADDATYDTRKRLWAWYKMDELAQQVNPVTQELYVDGETVDFVPDSSGNGRHLFNIDDPDGGTLPKFRQIGIGGRSTLRFDGDTTNNQYLQSAANYTDLAANRETQSTSIPGYVDSAFAIFIVLRAPQEATIGTVFSVERDTTVTGPPAATYGLFANRAANSGGVASGVSAGNISVFETDSSGASGTGAGTGEVLEGSFDNDRNTVLVTMLCDGGSSAHSSYFRVNGVNIDQYESLEMEIPTGPFYLGKWWNGNLPFTGEIAEVVVVQTQAYANVAGVLSHPTASPFVSSYGNATEIETVEGYLAHKWGIADLLDSPIDQAVAGTLDPAHPYYYDAGCPSPDLNPWDKSPESLLNSTDGILAKYAHADLEAVWVMTSYARWDGTYTAGVPNAADYDGKRFGGVGYACAATCDGNVFSIGPASSFSFSDANVTGASGPGTEITYLVDQQNIVARKVIDRMEEDTSYDPDTAFGAQGTSPGGLNYGVGAWINELPVAGSGDEFALEATHIAVDEFDNLVCPYDTQAIGGGAPSTSATVAIFDGDGDGAGAASLLNLINVTDSKDGRAARVSLKAPDYDGQAVDVHEHLYVSTNIPASPTDDKNLYKLRLVTRTAEAGATRASTNLVVSARSGGELDIRTFTTSAITTVATGGQDALDSATQYVDSTVLYGDVFFTDGVQYKFYDSSVAEVKTYKPTKGKVDDRYKLITNWRGRLVFARGNDDPHEWFMCKVGDPFNADIYPPIVTPTQAISGSASRAGRVPDIVNAVVPYNDDLLFFLGDHSVWRLSGDPMAGGQLDLVSDITGGSFGRSWAKDPDGVLYFFGSKGGVYAMVPGGVPKRISLYRIERRLQDIDLSLYRIELQWNYRDEGLHVFVIPYDDLQNNPDHYFWERKTDSWHKDFINKSQVTAVATLDGDDPDDRVLMLGFLDSRLRYWDKAAVADDDVAVDSYVWMGPYAAGGDLETKVGQLNVVLSNDGEVNLDVYTSDDPTQPGGSSAWSHRLLTRRSHHSVRATGPFVWFRLRDGAIDSRWSLESMIAQVFPGGRVRV